MWIEANDELICNTRTRIIGRVVGNYLNSKDAEVQA
jgi:hypothetical protein